MDNFLQTILYDPMVGKIVAAVVGIIVINLIIRFFQRLHRTVWNPKGRGTAFGMA